MERPSVLALRDISTDDLIAALDTVKEHNVSDHLSSEEIQGDADAIDEAINRLRDLEDRLREATERLSDFIAH